MPTWTPRKYQQTVLDFVEDRANAGLFLPPGLGKTSLTLYMINQMREKTLIIAPLRVIYSVWPKEIKKWDNFSNIKCTILHGPNKNSRFLSDKYGVYLINPEGIKWLIGMMEKHKRFPWKVLVIDESSKFKAHKSVRFKKLAGYLRFFKRRFILTGNPIPNTYLDLWSQLYILDRGEALGNNYYKYRNTYFYPGDFRGWSWKLHQGADVTIQEKIKHLVIHIDLEEIDEFDLPPLVENKLEFELPPKVVKAYKSMERNLFIEAEDSEKITAPTAAAKVQKLQQICNGFMYESLDEVDIEMGKEKRTFDMHNIKIDLLKEVVEELQGSPILVPYWFKEDFLRLRQAFPDAPYIGSGVSGEEGARIEDQWNAGEIPVLPVSMGSVSHGVNLQDGPGADIFFYCLTHDFDKYDQIIRRIWRQGAKHNRIMVHLPMAKVEGKPTADHVCMETVEEKDKTQSSFLQAVRKYIGDIQ